MKKVVCFLLVTVILLSLTAIGWLIRDYNQLHQNVIRLHVVANSNSVIDQQEKLIVRDAVLDYLQPLVADCANQKEAAAGISKHLSQIESAANQALQNEGSAYNVCVTLKDEAFGTRHYDTFTLPAGVYSSLRIQIGDGIGKNWWCVVFPSLCVPDDLAGFEDTAAGAGFYDSVRKTITNQDGYEIRFFMLDLLGKIENFLKNPR